MRISLLLVAPGAVVEHLQRHVERAGIVAAVVEIAGRDLIGKLVRLDEIVAPEPDRIEAELLDGGVHDPLDHEVRHLGAEAAAGALLAFVGEDGVDLGADGADLVRADGLRKTVAVRAEAVLEIGAVVVDDLVAQRRHPVVGVERKLDVVDAVRAVIVAGGDVVDPVLDIFDRAAGGARSRPRQAPATLCRNNLAAEAAAGIDRHDVDLMARDLERGGDGEADVVVHRRVDVDRELPRRLVEARHRAAGLDRLAAGARPAQAALDHVGGAGEFLLDRAEEIVAMLGDIVRAALGMQHRIAARIDRLHHVGDGRQRLVFDLDESDGVLGDVAAIGDDQRHRLADMAHLAERDAALLDRRVGKARQRPGLARRLLAGDHRGDAGQRRGRALVDRLDAGVRMRAAQHRGVRHVRQRDVVDKAAASDEEARVLLAQHARADDIEPLIRPLLLAAGRAAKGFCRLPPSAHRLFAAHQLDRALDRADDVLIAGAAADIVVEAKP